MFISIYRIVAQFHIIIKQASK